MAEYKSLYVRAGKREDGTYGVMRTAGTMVFTYNTQAEAEKDIRNSDEIVVDIGSIVDRNLMFMHDGNSHDWLDISSRMK